MSRFSLCTYVDILKDVTTQDNYSREREYVCVFFCLLVLWVLFPRRFIAVQTGRTIIK